MISSSCTTSDTRRVTLVKNQLKVIDAEHIGLEQYRGMSIVMLPSNALLRLFSIAFWNCSDIPVFFLFFFYF